LLVWDFSDPPLVVYYLPGAAGWEPFFYRLKTEWVLPGPKILRTRDHFGPQDAGFGFRVSWATNASVVIEAGASLDISAWSPITTNTLVEGWFDFSDPDWENHAVRFYRLRSQ
jgi:hypothetical protein